MELQIYWPNNYWIQNLTLSGVDDSHGILIHHFFCGQKKNHSTANDLQFEEVFHHNWMIQLQHLWNFTKVTISQIELKTFSRGFLRGFVSESTIVMKMISYLQILETKGKNSKIIHLKKINKLDQSYAVTKY